MITILPLTEELILNCSTDLYYMCGFWRYLGLDIKISLSSKNCTADIVLDGTKVNKKRCREILGVNSKSFNNYYKRVSTAINGDFMVMMPFETWDALFYYMQELPLVERKTITRVYLYLYYNAMRHYGQFARAREKIVEILHINKDTFSHAVEWLESKALLTRSDYLKKVTARTYAIPSILWTEECKRDCESRKKSC